MDAVARLLDATLNRAGEALRTAEDHARFVRDDAEASARLKRLRHALRPLRERLDRAAAARGDGSLLDARDSAGDVAATAEGGGDFDRADAEGVAAAALKRAEEALRSLAEFAKLADAEAAAEAERLRFAVYGLEARLLPGRARRERLRAARLYVLVTESLCSTDPLTACREAVAGGADLVQLREKELEDGAFYDRACAMREICRAGGALLIVNDRLHVARLADADGAHTGQGDLPPPLARRVLGHGRLLGKSTSAPEYAERAAADGCDYIGAGPVYETQTKAHRAAAGLEYVRWVSAWDRMPYFCIGSVNRDTVDAVLAAGARALAVCTAITRARDIAAETAWFKAKVTTNRTS